MQDSQLFLDISLDLLRTGHCIHFRAEGQSMQPTIRDGDMLTVEPIALEQVRAGDVLLYHAARGPLVHRVVRVVQMQKCGAAADSGSSVILRGDASDTCDDPVPVSRILGKVVQVDCASAAGAPTRWARWARWARTAVRTVLRRLAVLKNRVPGKTRPERASQLQ